MLSFATTEWTGCTAANVFPSSSKGFLCMSSDRRSLGKEARQHVDKLDSGPSQEGTRTDHQSSISTNIRAAQRIRVSRPRALVSPMATMAGAERKREVYQAEKLEIPESTNADRLLFFDTTHSRRMPLRRKLRLRRIECAKTPQCNTPVFENSGFERRHARAGLREEYFVREAGRTKTKVEAL